MQTDVRMDTNITDILIFSTLAPMQIFPRHVLEFLCVSSLDKVPGNISKLARRHDDVTILFMDIVGESPMWSGPGRRSPLTC